MDQDIIEPFFLSKEIGTIQIVEAPNIRMQYLPFVELALGVDQISAPFDKSKLGHPYHQTSSYQSLECGSSLVLSCNVDDHYC